MNTKQMNMRISLFTVIFLFSVNLLYSQDMPDEIDDRGFYIGASLQGTSFDLEALNDDSDTGGGIGLKAGYNFNTNFALFLSLDGSSMSPDEGDEYALAHFDLGAEGRLGNYENSFRPFGRVSLLGMAASGDDDVEISGGGIGLGVGLYYFVNNKFAFEIGYTHSWIQINEVKVGSISVEVEEDARSGRLGLGFSYHF